MNPAISAPEKPQLLQQPSHGTGRRAVNAKLTPEQVAEIRRSDRPNVELAALYGVSETTLSFVRRNMIYVDPAYEPPRRVLTSAQRGVRFHRQSGKWRVAFRRDRAYHSVGSFATEEEAIAAAVAWEVAHPLPPKAPQKRRRRRSGFARQTLVEEVSGAASVAPERTVYAPGELSPEMRAWVARRKREIAGEPLTAADKEQLARALEDTDAVTEHCFDTDGWAPR